MQRMKGTHGTCREFAKTIQDNGFRLSKIGRRGSGVYFWRYDSEELEAYASTLAESWHVFTKERLPTYRRASDLECVILFADIAVNKENFLDFEETSIKENFLVFANDVYSKVRSTDKHRREKLTSTYNVYIRKLEELTGRSFSVVHVRVSPPPSRFYQPNWPNELIGDVSCLVVKDVNCISIEKAVEV